MRGRASTRLFDTWWWWYIPWWQVDWALVEKVGSSWKRAGTGSLAVLLGAVITREVRRGGSCAAPAPATGPAGPGRLGMLPMDMGLCQSQAGPPAARGNRPRWGGRKQPQSKPGASRSQGRKAPLALPHGLRRGDPASQGVVEAP